MIRFYIDGTTGQKDGTEVTSINPITATGLFPSGSTAASKSVKVYIRADAGESYRQVLVGVNADKFTKCRITSFVNSCLFFIVAIKPGAQVGDLYPQNLLNFSFTETELTS